MERADLHVAVGAVAIVDGAAPQALHGWRQAGMNAGVPVGQLAGQAFHGLWLAFPSLPWLVGARCALRSSEMRSC